MLGVKSVGLYVLYERTQKVITEKAYTAWRQFCPTRPTQRSLPPNLGGVSVVLGIPVNLPDRNSDKLLELLLGSTVADDAVRDMAAPVLRVYRLGRSAQ